MENLGWIKLHRKLVDWQWYTDHSTFRLFFHLLLTANHKPAKWRTYNIERGQKLTSLDSLSLETGLTVQQVRTALSKLKSTGELTSISTSKNTIITITNYSLYQSDNTPDNNQSTNEQQTNNKPVTTNNNENNKKNEKNVRKDYPPPFEEFWNEYPRNGASKKEAFKSWNNVIKDTTDATIITAAREYRNYLTRTGTPTAHATTWLNQYRFTTDYASLEPNGRNDRAVNGGIPNQGGQRGSQTKTVGSQAQGLIDRILSTEDQRSDVSGVQRIASEGNKASGVLLENLAPVRKETGGF